MLRPMARDVRVIPSKLADRTLMRTLSDMPRSQVGTHFVETLEIYAPLQLPGPEPDLSRAAGSGVSSPAPWRYATLAKVRTNQRSRRRDIVQKVQSDVDAAFARVGMPVRLAGREKDLHAIRRR